MKAVLQKLFHQKARLEDAWASTRVDHADTQVLRHAADDDLCETVPMELMESVALS
jgi:hypothetical protein